MILTSINWVLTCLLLLIAHTESKEGNYFAEIAKSVVPSSHSFPVVNFFRSFMYSQITPNDHHISSRTCVFGWLCIFPFGSSRENVQTKTALRKAVFSVDILSQSQKIGHTSL